jgi:hypothetical protein
MIRVTIKDREALKSILLEDLKEYLASNKWYKREDLQRTMANGQKIGFGELWTQDTGPTARTAVVVPLNQADTNHEARMSEALMSLEKVEGRSQLEIFVDITKTPILLRPKKAKKAKKKI